MQSDTYAHHEPYVPDTDSEDDEYDSDSSGDLPKNHNIGVMYDFPKEEIQGDRFLDQSSKEHYAAVNRELFNPPLRKGRIVFYTNATGSYENTLDLVDAYKLNTVTNVIGFELIKATVLSGDVSNMFIDLYIPELPHIAGKVNEKGVPITERIPMELSTSKTYQYEQTRPHTTYFSPIRLSTLTVVQLLPATSDASPQSPASYKAIYEFEITILNQSLSKR
jgi:hypothetical protein